MLRKKITYCTNGLQSSAEALVLSRILFLPARSGNGHLKMLDEQPIISQWSLYVPPVVTICTAQWLIYAPHSGHYTYPTVVTICTAQWSLYTPHNGHYMYRTMLSICTARFNLQQILRSAHTVYLCVLC
jgi:hypothetical protein